MYLICQIDLNNRMRYSTKYWKKAIIDKDKILITKQTFITIKFKKKKSKNGAN